MRLLQLLHLDLAARRDEVQTLEVARKNLDRFEEMAQVLFWQALTEAHPAHSLLERRPWIDAWRIRLDPARWAEAGMLEPATAPRPLAPMRDNFTGIFAPQGLREIVLYEFPYRLLRWGRGFLYYGVVSRLRRWFVVNKPAMWLRALLVKDSPSRSAS